MRRPLEFAVMLRGELIVSSTFRVGTGKMRCKFVVCYGDWRLVLQQGNPSEFYRLLVKLG